MEHWLESPPGEAGEIREMVLVEGRKEANPFLSLELLLSWELRTTVWIEAIGGRTEGTQPSCGSSGVSCEMGLTTLTKMCLEVCAFSCLIGQCNTDISLPEAPAGEQKKIFSQALRSFLS